MKKALGRSPLLASSVSLGLGLFGLMLQNPAAAASRWERENNTPPVISGRPPATATAGVPYQYQPWASDADGDALSFKIRSRPSWATFDTQTGRLTGRPSGTDVGTYNNIVITVSDGKETVLLPAFSITVQPSAALTNHPPTISGAAPVAV